MMKLQLKNTEYGSLVRQLGDLDVFCANLNYFQEWFTTKEEARQKMLKHYHFLLGTYKRGGSAKSLAERAVVILEGIP